LYLTEDPERLQDVLSWMPNGLDGIGPRFIAPFPVAEWDLMASGASIQAADNGETGLEVFYSTTAVDADTHNMLLWSLD
jgi:hypothetical protein